MHVFIHVSGDIENCSLLLLSIYVTTAMPSAAWSDIYIYIHIYTYIYIYIYIYIPFRHRLPCSWRYTSRLSAFTGVWRCKSRIIVQETERKHRINKQDCGCYVGGLYLMNVPIWRATRFTWKHMTQTSLLRHQPHSRGKGVFVILDCGLNLGVEVTEGLQLTCDAWSTKLL